MTTATRAAIAALLLVAAAPTNAALAQPAGGGEDVELRPAFSLSTSQVFTTREAPHFFLTFRRLQQLDVRVYKVRDPFAFFGALDDPHQFGTDEPAPVAQERSWIERLSDWKRRQRAALRGVARAQVSRRYRDQRRAQSDRAVTTQRVQLNVNTFAQVPLLNPDQLVTSWRELLPNHRDPELRRVPLAVSEPGVYLVEAVHERLRAFTIVMVSDVGLVTKTSPGQVLLFAANRFTGEPLAGCQVRLLSARAAVSDGTTSDQGLFVGELPENTDQVLGVARCGAEVAATDPGAWALQSESRELVGYLYTDKPIYRPGHTVHAKAVLRWRERDSLVPFDRPDAELVASDANDKVVFRRTIRADGFGAITASFELPATAALGTYTLRVNSGDAQASTAFEVQEYRKPEFEVIVTPASRFVIQGRDAVVAVRARYYFGQPVANGRVRWVVNQQPYYSPLRWDEGLEEGGGGGYWYGNEQSARGDARLDADGYAELRIPLGEHDSARDYSARIEAQVTDGGGREVSGNTVVHATWASFLLAVQLDRSVFRVGSRADVQVRAVDYEGAPRAGVPVSLALERLDYREGYYNDPTVTPVANTAATTDAEGRASAGLALPEGQSGSFRIRVSAPADGREVTERVWLWVPGPQETSAADDGDRYLELLADRRTYQPGDTARLVVRGEPLSGPILVTKEGQHVSWYRVLRPAATEALEVPIEPGDIGDVYVNVTFLREGRLYRAERRLGVPAVERTLNISLVPDRPVAKPQEPGSFTLSVTDHEGRPVRAQVSLAVIDEAVFGVRADDTPDPTRFFYRREYSRVGTAFSREYYFTGYSGLDRLQLAGRRRKRFTLADFKGERTPQPSVRKDFPDAIYWMPDVTTDGEGRARVAVRYPDALTTWRLTARAVTEDTRVGAAVARTTTTKDLIVRIVTPRFLTEGDDVVIPAIVHNYRPEARTATVSVQTTGLEAVGAEPASSGILLPSGAEQRHDWRFRSPRPGPASITATARTESDTDAVELPVPVLPYGLRRDAGASGSIVGAGEGVTELVVPASANAAGRSVRVSLAPSLAGSLLGALDFLTGYPYGCTEQTVSSFLPNLLVTRALTELKLAPTERLGALDGQVSSGLRRLGDMQHADGGWGWWKSDGNHPFMTAYALWGLDEARRAGVGVEEYRIGTAGSALARMYLTYPRAEPDLKVYMAYVLRRSQPEGGEIVSYGEGGALTYRHADAREDVWNARDRMSPFGRALLLGLLDEARDARGDRFAQALEAEAQTRGELSWWAADRDDLLFDGIDTTVEATSFAVQALARRNPGSPVVERAVRWLLLNRAGGYWGSTKRTAMAIYGLLAFMQARGESAQPFSVDVFVNGEPAGRQSFDAARMTAPDPLVVTVPAREGANQIRLVKREGGTVYWSAAATWFDPSAADARQGSRQLAVSRRYSRLVPVTIRGRIVYREQPLAGAASPGDVLAVRLTVAGSPDWRYLAVEDPLPAGVEAVQDTTAYPLERPDTMRWWWGSQVEYRDTRTVFFQESFDQGRYEYVYLVKVIAAGTFRVVPAQVSPMYVPDVLASSEPFTLTVTVPGAVQP
ncbi:MAG TPA: MG2 domain-containing protein [Vicinamibacterales bacterium]|nr:MG2 domain-containing protein [Vicinamibacterales bacterium]